MRDFKEPTALLVKSRGISPVLEACPISDALITRIPADEEPLCGNAAVYAVIIMMLLLSLLLLLLLLLLLTFRAIPLSNSEFTGVLRF